MINAARMNPGDARNKICVEGLDLLGVRSESTNASVLHKAGINISEKMVQVPIRTIDLPEVQYAPDNKGRPVVVEVDGKGKWILDKVEFFDTGNELNGPIYLILHQDLKNTIRYHFDVKDSEGKVIKKEEMAANRGQLYASSLVDAAKKLGIRFDGQAAVNREYKVHEVDLHANDNLEESFNRFMQAAKDNKASIVIFVKSNKTDTDSFDEFKRAADQRFGIQSLCMTDASAFMSAKNHLKAKAEGRGDGKPWLGHMANLAMKIDLKLGNTNHTILDDSKTLRKRSYDERGHLDTIILGADATHVQKESAEGTPSLAAIVGSVDDKLGKFLGSVRAQDTNTEPVEAIKDMVIERLCAWAENNRVKGVARLPTKVLYYRDGVGQGQYTETREKELRGIREAYNKIFESPNLIKGLALTKRFDPKITAVIVTKRHQTRFFPLSEVATQNCDPGTVVDSGVTHPYYFDFYLQSHHAPAGTAKPTYYFVLENGMDYSPEELQNFTNMLCYTYVCATLPVGYASPTYYADWLCDRVRCYMRDAFEAEKKQEKARARQMGLQGVESNLDEEEEEDGSVSEDLIVRKKVAWFERYDANGGKEANPVGPWHKNLNDTMFWM